MKSKMPLVAKILIGFVAGTTIGVAISEFCDPETVKGILPYISPFGSVLVAMLKAVVFPVIFFSLILGAAALPLKKSGRIGGTVLLWYTFTSLFATVFGVALAHVMNPTMSTATQMAASHIADVKVMVGNAGSSSVADFLVGLFQNPFSTLSNGQFLPVIVFAVAFGLAARCLLDYAEDEKTASAVQSMLVVFDGVQRVSFKLIDCVILYFPIGVFALSLTNFAENGTLLFGPYLRIVACVVIGVLAMILVIYPLAILIFCHENPYRILLRFRQPIVTAFVTRSSAATLPISFKTMDEAGVARSLSSFSLPLGATVNMDGVCVHLPVFVILAANMFGLPLSFLQIVTLCISIMFASIGAGGIPGGSVFLLFMVLESMKLPPDQVSLIVALCMGINPILDMFETCCNVTGDNVCTYIVARRSGLVAGK